MPIDIQESSLQKIIDNIKPNKPNKKNKTAMCYSRKELLNNNYNVNSTNIRSHNEFMQNNTIIK